MPLFASVYQCNAYKFCTFVLKTIINFCKSLILYYCIIIYLKCRDVLNQNTHIIPFYVCNILQGLIVLAIPRLRSQVVTLFMFNIIKYFIPLTKSNQPATTVGSANITRRDGLWWTDSNDNTFARHVKEAFFKGGPQNIYLNLSCSLNYSVFYRQHSI